MLEFLLFVVGLWLALGIIAFLVIWFSVVRNRKSFVSALLIAFGWPLFFILKEGTKK